MSGTEGQQRLSERRWIGLGFVLLLALHGFLAAHYFFLCDDAFISFRYLRNWLAGEGLVYNAGERVEGYTNLGWILLLAPGVKLGLRPEELAPAISLAFSAALLLLTAFFLLLIRDRPFSSPSFHPLWLLAVPALLALNRSYAIWASSGLETRLFSFLILAGTIFVLRAFEQPRPAFLWAGLIFGAAEVVRPEGALFALVAFGLYALFQLAGKRRGWWKETAFGAATFLLILIIHYAWRYGYYGRLFPNTYYAKADSFWFSLGGRWLLMFAWEYGVFFWVLPVFYLLVKSVRRRWPAPLFLAGLIIPYLIYTASVGGDHFEYRFLDPVLPLGALLAVMSAREILVSLARRPLLRRATAGFLLLATGYAVFFPLSTESRLPTQFDLRPPPRSWWVRKMQEFPGWDTMMTFFTPVYQKLVDHLAGVRWEDHKLLAQGLFHELTGLQSFLHAGYLRPEEKLCITTAGIIPYYSGLWTLDYYGLTDAAVAEQRVHEPRLLFHDKKATPAYLRARGIDYIYYQFRRCVPEEGSDLFVPPLLPVSRDDKEFLERFGGRLYLVPEGEACFLFFSVEEPFEVRRRFQERGLEVIIYTPGSDGFLRPGG